MLREALADIRVRFNGRSEAALTVAERAQATARLRDAARMPPDELYLAQQTSAQGLTSEAAAQVAVAARVRALKQAGVLGMSRREPQP